MSETADRSKPGAPAPRRQPAKRRPQTAAAPARRRKRRVFYPIYFTLLIIAVGVITFGLRYVWLLLDDYESAMPKYVAERAAQMFLTRDFDSLYSYEDSSLFPYEGKEAYVAYMDEQTAGKTLSYQEVHSEDKSQKRYVVKADGEKIGAFTLALSGEKTEHGNDLWALAGAETYLVDSTTYTITAPSDSRVVVSGEVLSGEAIIESGIDIDWTVYLPKEVTAPTLTTYQLKRSFSEPIVEAIDRNGVSHNFLRPDGTTYIAEFNYSDSLKQEYEPYVFEVAKAISEFTSDDRSDTATYKYFYEGSPADKSVRGFDEGWFGGHSGHKFENMTSYEYIGFGSDCFVCSISYDYIIKFDNREDGVYPTNYFFCFKKNGTKWLLYNFATL